MPRLQLPRPPERKPLPRPGGARPSRATTSKGSSSSSFLPRPPTSRASRTVATLASPKPTQQELPQWETLYTDDGRPYYCNTGTNETVWERPVELAPPPEETTNDNRSPTNDDMSPPAVEPTIAPTPEPVVTPPVADPVVTDAAIDTTKTEEKEEEPLPPGWTACFDDATQQYYYTNNEHTTTWERPTHPAVAVEATPVIEEDIPAATGTSSIAPLPDGWTEHVSDDGTPYYVCDVDGASTWERPAIVEPTVTEPTVEEETTPLVVAEVDEPPVVAPEQAVDEPGDAALPPGWVELYDEGAGQPYYLYEPDQSVTWDRPTDVGGGPPPVDDTTAPPLEVAGAGAGAEDLNYAAELSPETAPPVDMMAASEPEVAGGMFSEDASPAPEVVVETDAPLVTTADLPPGWQEMKDFDGNVYYYNTVDDSTTWDKPGAVETAEEEEENPLADDAPDAAEADLPSEWQQTQDDEGNVYYFNTVDGSTSWEKPGLVAEQSNDDAAVGPPNEPSIEHVVPDNVAAVEEVVPAVIEPAREEHNVPEEIVAAPPTIDDLPPGWEALQDDAGNTYYCNSLDGTTTWDRPMADGGTDEVPPPIPETSLEDSMLPADVTTAAQEDVPAMVPEVEAETSAPPVEEFHDTSSPENTMEDAVAANPESTAGFLLPGWQELKDEQGTVYYHNLVDGTTTWARPIAEEEAASIAEGEASAEASIPPINQVLESTVTPTEMTAPEPEPEATATEAAPIPTDLPPNWEEVQLDDGTVYYFNTVDQTSSWERPVSEPSTNVAAEETPESLPEMEPTAPAVEPSSQQEASELKSESEGPLPEGWTEAVTDDGTPFYINGITQQSVWERPVASLDADLASPPNSGDQYTVDDTHQVSPKSEDFSYEEVDPIPSSEPLRDGWVEDMDPNNEPTAQDELPPGWKELHDMDTGGIYYLNEVDGSTQWERPLQPDAANRATTGGETQGVPEETGKEAIDEGWTTPYAVPSLAEGWTEHVDPSTGNPYYYNEATGETTHERPHPKGGLDAKPTNLGYEHERPPRDTSFPAIVSFGFGGKICIVRPQAKSVVKIYRTHQLLPDEPICQLASANSASGIAGPLAKLPNDVVSQYIDSKAGFEDDQLLWSLVSIAAKCRGRLRSLRDTGDSVRAQPMIANLLVKDYGSQCNQEVEPELGESSRESLVRVEQLLVDGKREEAVEHAIQSDNFPMAILIASMLGRDALMKAVNGYIEKAHFTGKPLHALALLFSGLLKPSSSGTGSYWDEVNPDTLKATWKYHLAGIINNTVEKWEHLVVALGTRLAQIDPDNVVAAHVCYLVCGCAVGRPNTGAPILLLGSSSTLTDLAHCSKSAIESFQLTEAYEWAKRRGNTNASIRSLQVFKVVLAHQLCEFGFVHESKLYLESVIEHLGWTIHDAQSLPQSQMLLSCGSEDLANEDLVSLAANLFCRLTGSAIAPFAPTLPADATDVNASFMTAHTHFQDEDAAIPEDDDVVAPLNPPASPFSSHVQVAETPTNEIPPVGIPPTFPKGLDSQPPPVFAPTAPNSAPLPPAKTNLGGQVKPPAVDTAPPPNDSAPLITPGTAQAKPETAPSSAPANLQPSKSAKNSSAKQRSFFNFGIKEYVIKKLNPEATTADLGGNMEAYYDEDKKVWVFPGEDPAEKVKPIPPPPTGLGVPSSAPEPTPAATNDPLAAMMAPPSRAPSARKTPNKAGKPPAFPPGMAPRSAPSKPVNFSAFAPPPSAL